MIPTAIAPDACGSKSDIGRAKEAPPQGGPIFQSNDSGAKRTIEFESLQMRPNALRDRDFRLAFRTALTGRSAHYPERIGHLSAALDPPLCPAPRQAISSQRESILTGLRPLAIVGSLVAVGGDSMSAGMRWVLGVVSAILFTAIISSVGTAVFFIWQPRPDVPLTTKLGGNWEAINREFDSRVRARFPVGSAEVEMARELQREGFTRDDWSFVVAQGAEAKATRREDRIVCRQAANVYWRANPQGRLTSIRGVYRVERCL